MSGVQRKGRRWMLALGAAGLASAGFLGGIAYALVAVVPAAAVDGGPDRAVHLMLSTAATTRAEMREELRELRAELGVRRRARPTESAADGDAAVASGVPETASGAARRPSSRMPAGRADSTTPRGAKLRDDLLRAAGTDSDQRRREAAVRGLAGMFGNQTAEELAEIASDPAQSAEVRATAAEALRVAKEGSE